MIIYNMGEKAARSPSHLLTICPGRHLEGQEQPSDWVDAKNEPIEFRIHFAYGRAEVPKHLGEYMIKHGLASKTALVLTSAGLV